MRAIYAFETIETLQFTSHRLCGREKIRFIARVKEGGRLALLVSNTGECGRVALRCSTTGSMWANRPPWQQHRINVGESPSVAATQDQCGRVALRCSNTGSMCASRPPCQQHSINVGEPPTLLLRPMAQTSPSSVTGCLSGETVCRFNRDFPSSRR